MLHTYPVRFRGKAAMAARLPSSVIFLNHHKCLSGKASMAERLPLAPNYLSPHQLEHLLLLLPPGSARRDESTSDSDPKWSPYLLVLRRLLPWIDPKWSPHLSCSPTGCCNGNAWIGESGRQPGTVSFGYVSLAPSESFLVRRSGKKSMLSRYSFLEVNEMYQLAEWRRGSKSRMLLLAHSCQSL